jgi:RND family efflux transporter MFP subunit
MKRWVKVTAATVAVLLLGALLGRALMARKAEQAKAAVPVAASVIDLAPGDVVVAAQAELVRTLAISGGLKAVSSAVVKAKVAAEVKDIAVREGDTVQAGQLLARLDPTEFAWKLRQAEDQANAAQAQLDSAQRTLENNRALVAQGFISKNALDNASFSSAGAQASMRAAQAAAELARKSVADTEIRAPIGGLISQRLVQPGERVPIDGKLLEIVDLSRIELEAALAPDEVGAVALGARAQLQVDGLAAPVAAKVVRINPSTQAGTRAVMVYLALDPVPGLRQGLFARGAIDLQRQPALVLPLSAIRIEQARPYVLLVADGKTQRREVALGRRGDAVFGSATESAVEVLDGVTAGQTVLRGTASTVGSGMAVRLAGTPAP